MKMNSCNINSLSLETILMKKLELADKALDLLPSSVQTVVKGLRTQVLTSLRDSLDQYLKNGGPVNSGSTLKKIELE